MYVSRARIPDGIVKSLVFFVLVGIRNLCMMYMLVYEDCLCFMLYMHYMNLYHYVIST